MIGCRQLKDGSRRYYARVSIHGTRRNVGSFLKKSDAVALAQKLQHDATTGKYFPERIKAQTQAALTVADLCDAVVADYRRNGQRLADAESLTRLWLPYHPVRVSTITSATFTAWADAWLEAGLSAGTINRRIRFLLRGYTLLHLPKVAWTALTESPPRSGFLTYEQFVAVRNLIPPHGVAPLTILYWTGMRYGEVQALLRSQCQFDHHRQRVILSLAGSQTKTKTARQVVFHGELYRVLHHADTETARLYPNCLTLCHRQGKPLGTMDTAWKSACVKAGIGTGEWIAGRGYWLHYSGPLIHDLRRTGARNLIRAGVDRDTAKRITGHKTDSTFSRYNIVNEEDLALAGQRVSNYVTNGSQMALAMDLPFGP